MLSSRSHTRSFTPPRETVMPEHKLEKAKRQRPSGTTTLSAFVIVEMSPLTPEGDISPDRLSQGVMKHASDRDVLWSYLNNLLRRARKYGMRIVVSDALQERCLVLRNVRVSNRQELLLDEGWVRLRGFDAATRAPVDLNVFRTTRCSTLLGHGLINPPECA